MTRKKEIEQAAEEHFAHSWSGSVKDAFVEGAQWADKHPSIDTVKKIVCFALKKTNIMLANDLENGVEWELLIKQAMKGE